MSVAVNDSFIDEESEKVKFLESIKQEMGDRDIPRACGFQIVVRVHERDKGPHKVKDESGNVILNSEGRPLELSIVDKSLKYDRYTRNVGQVLGLGPVSYKGEKYIGQEPYCKVGQWILFPKNSGAELLYCGIPCRIMNDDKCLAIVDDPNYIE